LLLLFVFSLASVFSFLDCGSEDLGRYGASFSAQVRVLWCCLLQSHRCTIVTCSLTRNSHAKEGDIPGTVNLAAAEGDDTGYGQALFPVPANDPNDP
jgi:hypothetical protein